MYAWSSKTRARRHHWPYSNFRRRQPGLFIREVGPRQDYDYVVPPVHILPNAYLKVQMLHITVESHSLEEARLLVNHVIGLAQLRQLDVCVFALVFKNNLAAPELSYLTTPLGVASFCPPHYECNVIQAFCINALKQLSIHFKDCLVASSELATDGAYMWQHSDARLKIWHGSQVTERNLLLWELMEFM